MTLHSIADASRHIRSLQPRVRMLATFELAERSPDDLAMVERWLDSAPLSFEVEPDREVVFVCAISADGLTRRFSLDAGATSYLVPALGFFGALGVEAVGLKAMRQLVEDVGVVRLGSWVEEGENRATVGWSLPSGLLLDTALALAPDSDARKVVSRWARAEGATFARRFEFSVGPHPIDAGLARLTIPLGDFESALGAARRAFDATGAPWPEEAIGATLALFSPTSLELTLTLTTDGVERIGIIAPSPSRELVLAVCDLGCENHVSCDERLAHYEATLGAKAPSAVEMAIGRDGFEVFVHLGVG